MKRNPTIYINKNESFQNYLKWSNEKSVILKILKKIIGHKKETLLDIGAGDGTFCHGLEKLFKHITAVEPSKNTLPELMNKCDFKKYLIIHNKFENVRFKEKFDVILLAHTLRFLKNPDKQIEKIKLILNDNGLLIIVANSFDKKYNNFYQTFKKNIIRNPKDKFYFDYTKILADNNMSVKVISAKTTLKIPTINDAVSMLDFFYDTDMKKISIKTKKHVAEYLKTKFKDGPIIFQYPQKIFIAKKDIF